MLVVLPLHIDLKKRFYINLNTYRNTHHYILNNAKIAFKEAIQSQIDKLPVFNRIELTYILFPKTKREMDIANVCSVADKFFSDALVESGKLPDDNYKYITNVQFRFGDVDPKNPRVEVHIKETEMKIILDQADIRKAIESYVYNMLPFSSEYELAVSEQGDDTLVTVTEVTVKGPSREVIPADTLLFTEQAAKDNATEAKSSEPVQNISTGEERVDPTETVTEEPAVTATPTQDAPVAQESAPKEQSTPVAEKPSLLNQMKKEDAPMPKQEPAPAAISGAGAAETEAPRKSLFAQLKMKNA